MQPTQVETVEDYDLYCHYVAGLVGIGLSKLFAASGRESADLATSTELANHMGLFLQKTNIIRDYLVRGAVGSCSGLMVNMYRSTCVGQHASVNPADG